MAKVDWQEAEDIKRRVSYLVNSLQLGWVNLDNVFCFRSNFSSARAYARIWGLNNVWQKALSREPAYVIEVLSERYDGLRDKKKDEILLHELAHIPKNFSGALKPHTYHRSGSFHDVLGEMMKAYKKL